MKLDPIPHFENIDGYSLELHHYEGVIFKKAIYEYTANLLRPLTFVSWNNIEYRPDNHLLTNMASVPIVLQAMPGLSKDRHLLPCIFHDSAYCKGGLYVRTPTSNKFKFIPMERVEADDLLRLMCLFDLAPSPLMSWVYWLGVRLGGRWSWKRGDWRKHG